MRSPLRPLMGALIAATMSGSSVPQTYSLNISLPANNSSLSITSLLTVTASIYPSLDISSVLSLYDNTNLIGEGTIVGTNGIVVSDSTLTSGSHNISVATTINSVTYTSDVIVINAINDQVTMTIGTPFIPRVYATDVVWTFPDATTTTALLPTYNGISGTAYVRGNNITALNFGFNGEDGGYNYGSDYSAQATYQHSPTNITAITNLQQAAPNLERFFGNNTAITSVDFSNLTSLEFVEFFYASNQASNISSVNLNGCTNLRRFCFENANLTSLDISSVAHIEDVRSRGQTGGSQPFNITFGDVSQMIHLCVGNGRVNGVDGILTGSIVCPQLVELWTFGCQRPLVFAPNLPCSGSFLSIQAFNSTHTGFDSTNINWPISSQNECQFRYNNLNGGTFIITQLMAERCVYAEFDYCNLNQTQVDHILEMYANHSSLTAGSLLLSGTNAVPSTTGLSYVDIIRARGMTVTHAS